MKRILVWLLLIALVAAVPVYLKRADIATAIMERAAPARMMAEPLADLGDGLHVALCGAGGPMPDPRRSGPCVAVAAGARLFVVDAGTGGVRNLGLMDYPIGAIEAVLLTHFHSDHIDGLGELATLRWVQGAHKTPLTVFGPPGVSDVVYGFNEVYAQDRVYRNLHHGDKVAPLSGHGMLPYRFEAPAPGQAVTVLEEGGLVIEAFTVDHAPVTPAVGYRFRYRDRSVVISGDTARSSTVLEMARGADLLVHEALSRELVGVLQRSAAKVGNARFEKITVDILDYHASPTEAAEIARDAGVQHLLFYHIVPALPLPGLDAAWLEGVPEIFPDYTLGRDGTVISLPAGSTAVEVVSEGF